MRGDVIIEAKRKIRAAKQWQKAWNVLWVALFGCRSTVGSIVCLF